MARGNWDTGEQLTWDGRRIDMDKGMDTHELDDVFLALFSQIPQSELEDTTLD
jgi:hypothetical protein